MLNTFRNQENIPDELYKVEIKSIYKGKGDIGNLENHRGIFLNSNILKLLETRQSRRYAENPCDTAVFQG